MRFKLRPMFGVFTYAAICIGTLTLAFTGSFDRLTGMLAILVILGSAMTGIAAYKLRKKF